MTRNQRRRVTAADVAALANCTPAAVSLWINGKIEGRISPEVGRRIQDAIEALGYVPNRTAQQLSTGKSRQVTFVFPDAWYTYFSFILDGITAESGASWDFSLITPLPHERQQDGDRAAIQRALRTSPGALIVASPELKVLEELPPDLPTVVVDAERAPEHCSLVNYDFDPGIQQAADLLTTLGHRRIGYIGLDRLADTLVTRRTKLEKALAQNGATISQNELNLPSVRAGLVAETIKNWMPSDITALVCGDEILAYGALSACQSLGISVPQDLSIISFNDLEPAALVHPSLTSIHMPGYQIGALAGELLADRIAGGPATTRTLATHLVKRASTGPPPK